MEGRILKLVPGTGQDDDDDYDKSVTDFSVRSECSNDQKEEVAEMSIMYPVEQVLAQQS
jgi:hypothetical protein